MLVAIFPPAHLARQVGFMWTMELAEAQVSRSCVRVAQELRRVDPFCLWLNGEVGAGKTSWVSAFLHHLGLEHSTVVASPTFVYARTYDIGGELYNHCDLYRVESVPAWRALGIEISHYRGMVLEWATPANCDTMPTHRLHLEFGKDIDTRRYVFSC